MVAIRLAERRDVNDAARVAHVAYQKYTARIGRPPGPMGANYAAVVRSNTMWVAEHDNRLVGFVVLVNADDHLLLDNVAVDPLAQGMGIGTQLLALAEDEARRRGYNRIKLYTNEAMTENLEYYPRKGFVETHRGEQDGYLRVFFTKTLYDGPSALGLPEPADRPDPGALAAAPSVRTGRGQRSRDVAGMATPRTARMPVWQEPLP